MKKTVIMLLMLIGVYYSGKAQIMLQGDTDFGLRLYPNPAANYVEVLFQAPAGSVQVEIFNLLGHRVMPAISKVSNGTELTLPIEVRSLPSGIYLVRIVQGNQGAVRRLTVQH
jgi:hypothetical protein